MFSATRFQLDHYTNIIIPFASIVCAVYLQDNLQMLLEACIVPAWLEFVYVSHDSWIICLSFRLTPPVGGSIVAFNINYFDIEKPEVKLS